MNTKIRTFIGMVALGVVGLANINATTVNKREVTSNDVSGKVESVASESAMFEDIYRTIQSQNETLESEIELKREFEGGTTNEMVFFNSADSYTAKTADREIEKYSNKQVALEELRSGK
ncbi:MAG TPA: hypothetical protein VGK10_05050 [Prolixibacteraceae bacterium]|jgi:hypothetical protein